MTWPYQLSASRGSQRFPFSKGLTVKRPLQAQQANQHSIRLNSQQHNDKDQ